MNPCEWQWRTWLIVYLWHVGYLLMWRHVRQDIFKLYGRGSWMAFTAAMLAWLLWPVVVVCVHITETFNRKQWSNIA